MRPKHATVSISPARRAAFDALIRVETQGGYASAILATIPEPNLSSEDRALAQEITLGVLRWQGYVDYFIKRYAGRAIDRLDVAVVVALRMGLYQLRFLSRVPHSAAVNESVELVKRARVSSAAAIVNAVLRKAARNPEDKPGADIREEIERASVELSHPRWLLERWRNQLGEAESSALALANNVRPHTSFRVNTLRATTAEVLEQLRSAGLTVEASDHVPGAFIVEAGPPGELTGAARRGLVYLQDEASQLVSIILEPKRGDRILDLCAAPGSKSTHIAALTGGDCWILASDIHPHRLLTLRRMCRQLGANCIDAVALDATRPLPFIQGAPPFDRVLVDAPCSGTGTLRRNPEIKWRLAAADIARLGELQLALLERAAGAVKRGGRLVYSTCSIEPEENEGVVDRFLGSAPFRLIRPAVSADLATENGYLRTFPQRHGMDGFFAANLERE
ncbi:MAG TPA: 16S rRNA (cytosine(967)-C(5))-methyltransferase RsmB [Blastocatellia bacterium]|nr:16S rRNA (cytosine(967)-C(5))-methyltransferase RsmB [Blastocatellia bacterium]